MIHWPNTLKISRSSYDTSAEYKEAYREAKSHYQFRVKVDGGWIFFEYGEDYDLWKKQK